MLTDIQKSMAIMEWFREAIVSLKMQDWISKEPVIQQLDFVFNTLKCEHERQVHNKSIK